jgi:hypothetical protein
MNRENNTNSPDTMHDDLQSLDDIGATTAQALDKIGIYSFADLAQYTPKTLSKVLREQAGLRVTAKRIETKNWIGQARAALAHKVIPTVRAGEPERGAEGADSAGWHEDASFSIFFDSTTGETGKRIWQTRVYDNASGREEALPGLDTVQWVNWIVERANLPFPAQRLVAEDEVTRQAKAAAEALMAMQEEAADPARPGHAASSAVIDTCLDIKALRVFEAAQGEDLGEKNLVAEFSFQVVGENAAELTASAPRFRVELHALDQDTDTLAFTVSEQGQLQPQALEYTHRVTFPMPELGVYQLHGLVLLMPPGPALAASYQGPVIRIVQ